MCTPSIFAVTGSRRSARIRSGVGRLPGRRRGSAGGAAPSGPAAGPVRPLDGCAHRPELRLQRPPRARPARAERPAARRPRPGLAASACASPRPRGSEHGPGQPHSQRAAVARPAVGVAYFADPLVQPRSTARLGARLMSAVKRAGKELDRLKVPTLVIHGGADTLVPTSVSAPLGRLPGVERRVLPGLRHETLNEPEGPEVVAGIVDWLRARIADGIPVWQH